MEAFLCVTVCQNISNYTYITYLMPYNNLRYYYYLHFAEKDTES